MRTVRVVLVCLQASTFVGLVACFLGEGNWRLALAQGCLCVATLAVYA